MSKKNKQNLVWKLADSPVKKAFCVMQPIKKDTQSVFKDMKGRPNIDFLKNLQLLTMLPIAFTLKIHRNY